MSVYADYANLAEQYDSARRPQGAHLYLGLVYTLTKKTAENLNLLDLGCGTGNHVKYLLDQGLGKATIFDANEGMLKVAKSKLANFVKDGKVKIEQHQLPEIPYDDNIFDVVTTNQVLHHLVDLKNGFPFSKIPEVMREAFRVLKPNGVFIINTTTPYQALHGHWYGNELFLNGKDTFENRQIDQEEFLDMLRKAGFTSEGMIVEPLDLIPKPEWYFREDGPLDPEWRKGDTMLTVDQEHLNKVTEKVQKEVAEGTMKQFMMSADRKRKHVGQYCIFYAKKA